MSACAGPSSSPASSAFPACSSSPNRLKADIKSRPPVLLVHGDRDEVIPVQALQQARTALAEAGVPVEWHVSPGLPHEIDGDGLDIAGRFLANAFKP